MLLLENPGGERLGRILIENRNRSLQNNGTLINAFRHKMHRASGQLTAPFNGLFLYFEPWKRRQE